MLAYLAGRKICSKALGHDEVDWNILDLLFLWLSGRDNSKDKWEEQRRQEEKERIERQRIKAEEESHWSKTHIAKNGLKFMDVCILNIPYVSKKDKLIDAGTKAHVRKIHEDGDKVRIFYYADRHNYGRIEVSCDDLTPTGRNIIDTNKKLKKEHGIKFICLGDYGKEAKDKFFSDNETFI